MRILIFHGYLLGGTGSNVYNARLAAALVRAGHEVHLLCQERDPFEQEWVDAAGDWDVAARCRSRRGASPVRATVYRPDLGGLLPVYVADRYEGIEAKPFPELTDAELDGYLERNVAAVREVAELVAARRRARQPPRDGPGRARAGARRRPLRGQGPRLGARVHGQAAPRALPPLRPRGAGAGARAVLVGSRHTAESLWAAMDDPGLEARTKLGPPGVDIAEFTPREPGRPRARASSALVERLRATRRRASPTPRSPATLRRPPRRSPPSSPTDRLVVFVGKLIASKGVDLLLAAWPLVVERVPDAKLVIVGFGAFREGLERLAADLAAGDLDAVRATRGENGLELQYLARLPRRRAATGYGDRPADRVVWAGRLDHAELADLLPATEAMVVPSTFPEAFGMVAAEARRLRLAARRGAPLRARRGRGDARRRPSRRRRGRCWASSAARARCRSWRPPWPAGSRRRRPCAPPPATRWWRSRASATRGTASRGPCWPPRRAAWTGLPAP